MRIDVYNKLRKYESYLYTAHYANYIRALTNVQVNELIEIAEKLDIHYKNNHCPKCALEFIKKLAAPFFEQKKNMEKKCTKTNAKTNEE